MGEGDEGTKDGALSEEEVGLGDTLADGELDPADELGERTEDEED